MGLASASEQQELQNDAQYCILTIPDAYAIIYNEEIWSLVKKTEKTVRLVKKIKACWGKPELAVANFKKAGEHCYEIQYV